MEQIKKSIEVSDRKSKLNPSYDELQNVLVEMHGDAMNAFKTIGTQKRTILKLEAEIILMRKDFEDFKNEHASLKKEIFAIPSKVSPTIDDPKSSNEDINFCLACPRL
jgi:peptidoglycan hydrolase CwlO-like protein